MTEITLLDGGMGQELTHRAPEKPTALWGTQVMFNHPGMVQQVHADYFAAGATVATANTYAIHHDRLVDTPCEGQFSQLHALALSEAHAARDAHGSGKIAGAIGPLIASYRPDIHPKAAVAIPLYAEIAQTLAPGCDLILCETVASLDHARSILAATVPTGLPVWLAVTVDDRDGTRLRSGEPVSDVLPIAKDGGAAAILVNCSAPEAIHDTLRILATGDLPFGAYANGFQKITAEFLQDKPTVDALTSRDLSPDAYAEHAMAWIDAGATVVGGCCEVGPAHISALARAITDAGHTIV
ncbi:homocysteine S-methyltransferase family protein [Loktanella sp. SALINAS62]|uniref:homocysteine S-methyltransferase family protein n=1 Tax=Loktanella sp. SALINAS62 TaxID=2706124 RepID=UPI001B8CD853|nr:homocysteine S-methyltransferase family protein [Loktanella sp. SALINAS62]MBS1302387.1 homocysteine S-methyltransferase family protein [Loktanella sp. SALINAS62]